MLLDLIWFVMQISAFNCRWHIPGYVPELVVPKGQQKTHWRFPGRTFGCDVTSWTWIKRTCLLKGQGSFVGSVRASGDLDCFFHTTPGNQDTGKCTISLYETEKWDSALIPYSLSTGDYASGYIRGQYVGVACVNAAMYLDWNAYRAQRQICRYITGPINANPQLKSAARRGNPFQTDCDLDLKFAI